MSILPRRKSTFCMDIYRPGNTMLSRQKKRGNKFSIAPETLDGRSRELMLHRAPLILTNSYHSSDGNILLQRHHYFHLKAEAIHLENENFEMSFYFILLYFESN